MKLKIYADGADLDTMIRLSKEGVIKGFTTNPTLMKKAGVTDYTKFAKDVVSAISDRPISFEVFSDDFETMEKEAKKIASLGKNVYVKIPITNSEGESSIPLIQNLSKEGVNLNVTAILTLSQVEDTVAALSDHTKSIVSVFAGRIADTGVDPVPMMKESASICHSKANVELLWASPREVLNVVQADEVGADIITCTPAIIEKIPMIGKDLTELSLETVQMFYEDGRALGFSIL